MTTTTAFSRNFGAATSYNALATKLSDDYHDKMQQNESIVSKLEDSIQEQQVLYDTKAGKPSGFQSFAKLVDNEGEYAMDAHHFKLEVLAFAKAYKKHFANSPGFHDFIKPFLKSIMPFDLFFDDDQEEFKRQNEETNNKLRQLQVKENNLDSLLLQLPDTVANAVKLNAAMERIKQLEEDLQKSSAQNQDLLTEVATLKAGGLQSFDLSATGGKSLLETLQDLVASNSQQYAQSTQSTNKAISAAEAAYQGRLEALKNEIAELQLKLKQEKESSFLAQKEWEQAFTTMSNVHDVMSDKCVELLAFKDRCLANIAFLQEALTARESLIALMREDALK